TAEKERNTLQLLLITTLSPEKIVIQKFLGRLTPILTYLSLSFPVLALAYSLGGVSVSALWGAGLILLFTAIQLTALAVACSAYCSTTMESLIWYLGGFFLTYWLLTGRASRGGFDPMNNTIGSAVAAVVFGLFLTGIALIFAISVLESRAALTPKNPLLLIFQMLDRTFNRWNTVTGGAVLVKDGDPLPASRPVAWRETAKKSLGTFRYLFRVLLILQAPLIVLLAIVKDSGRPDQGLELVAGYLNAVLVIMTAMLIIHASSLIAAERGRQTLQVLLSTPIEGADLLRQKQAGVMRMSRVMLIPVLTILMFQAWWYRGLPHVWASLAMTFFTVLLLQRLLTWVAISVGLRVHSQLRAMAITGVLVLAWWAIGQLGLYYGLGMLSIGGLQPLRETLLEMHPLTTLAQMQNNLTVSVASPAFAEIANPRHWVVQGAGLLLHLLAYLWLKGRCLKQADRLLGRLSESTDSPETDSLEAAPLVADGPIAMPMG
ncbi:MAG: ABC transporter permease, partial [Planctomycetaceae bacterium]